MAERGENAVAVVPDPLGTNPPLDPRAKGGPNGREHGGEEGAIIDAWTDTRRSGGHG